MPTFLRRIKRSFQPRSRHNSQGHTTFEAPVRDNQNDDQTAKKYDYDEEDRRDRRNPSPPLPVIRDRGPPTANRYADADIFWNSTMIEADESEKTWLPTKVRRGRSNIEDTQLPGVAEAGPSKQTPPTNPLENIQEEASSTVVSDTTAVRKRRYDGFRRLERNISYGKERADNDLIAMFYAAPEYVDLPAMETRQQIPLPLLTPATSQSSQSTTISLQDSTAVRQVEREPSSAALHESASLSRPRHVVRRVRNMPNLPTVYHSAALSPSPSSQTSTTLTWNTVLNEILNNDAVDPAMKAAVRDRVKSSKITNGNGDGDHVSVSAKGAGLVPNFTYPVVASRFFDCLDIEASPHPSMTERETRDDDTKQERQTPRIIDRSLADFDFSFDTPTRQPCSSTPTASSDSLYRLPSPTNTDTLKSRTNALLSEVLTPSELSLCHAILAIPINHTTTDRQTHLTHALHTLVYHLQDRTSYLEDTLLPRLSIALQRRSRTIDALAPELSRLSTQVRKLSRAIDFSNDVLAGCWMREYEVWRTLVRIRDGRAKRVWGWIRGREQGEQRLTGREVEALVLIAEQNLGILREDVGDMVGMVERCLGEGIGGEGEGERRKKEDEEKEDEENEAPEGSWRDV